jgi:hypothetical protein
METALQNQQQQTPTLAVRLLWWFGIYLAGSLPITVLIPLFPLGLAAEYAAYAPPGWNDLVMMFLSFLAYAIYGIHLWLTLRAKTFREFLVLIFSFVFLVFATFMGCGMSDVLFGT